MRHYYSLVLTATFFGFIFSGSISTAQNTRGIVIDKISKKPVAGVSVYINETGIGTTTNEKGEFNFKYFTQINENDTLTFSSIGYVTRKVALPEIKKSSYIVLLSENSSAFGAYKSNKT